MMPGNAPGDATMADAAAIQRAFGGTRDGSSPGWTTPPAPAPSPALAVPAEIRALGVRKLDATRNDADASARAEGLNGRGPEAGRVGSEPLEAPVQAENSGNRDSGAASNGFVMLGERPRPRHARARFSI